ncbi:quinone oxidoreductase family protein [Halorarius halobius]|uniref:quinone oxidoreductase family protein n=1 Tax=Halorarius halobius TaxID=2962671 RepID=UPI0020CF2C12|nr:NADPH:quinone reductase [Halorarius halobius]
MRAVRYREAGGPEVLQVEETERPTPGPGEVLVAVRAASVNPIDAILRASVPPDGPRTTGSDVAGVVESVGPGVDDIAVGDRVVATGLHNTDDAGGSFAEYATVPTHLLAPLPDGVSFEAGAAVALVGVTAWRAFVHHGRLEPGQRVLVHGGNGGLGHVAVQLADAMGASAVATARAEHHERVREFGADAVVDYGREDLAAAVLDAGDPVDVVLDHMPDRYAGADVEVAAFGGSVVVVAGDEATFPDVAAARGKELAVHWMSMSNLVTHPELPDIGPILERFGRLLEEGRIEVAIDRTVSLEEGDEAHRVVMEESVVGKVVVVP